jgi:hypothetical protein
MGAGGYENLNQLDAIQFYIPCLLFTFVFCAIIAPTVIRYFRVWSFENPVQPAYPTGGSTALGVFVALLLSFGSVMALIKCYNEQMNDYNRSVLALSLLQVFFSVWTSLSWSYWYTTGVVTGATLSWMNTVVLVGLSIKLATASATGWWVPAGMYIALFIIYMVVAVYFYAVICCGSSFRNAGAQNQQYMPTNGTPMMMANAAYGTPQ